MKKFAFILISIITLSGCNYSTNEITNYPTMCNTKDQFGKCIDYTPFNRTTYVINSEKQSVVSYMPGIDGVPTQRYTNCAIVNIENWSCQFNDDSGTFGFSEGKFFNYPDDNFDYISKDQWEAAYKK